MSELTERSKAIMATFPRPERLSLEEAEVLIRRSVEWSKCGMKEEKIALLSKRMVSDFKWLAPEVFGPTVAPWINAHFPWALGKTDEIGTWPGKEWADLRRQPMQDIQGEERN